MTKLAQWTTLTARTGQRDEVAGLALEMAELARASVPGCEIFQVCVADSRPDVVWLFELFDSRESHDALGALNQAADIGRRTTELLAGPPEQIDMETW